MEIMMRRVLIGAMQAALFGCIPAFAQVGGMGSPTPGIGATSPLGMAADSPVPPTGGRHGARVARTQWSAGWRNGDDNGDDREWHDMLGHGEYT
jgi:hypothetical protein